MISPEPLTFNRNTLMICLCIYVWVLGADVTDKVDNAANVDNGRPMLDRFENYQLWPANLDVG